MAIGQDLLDRMEVLDNELKLQDSEEDVSRGLVALNIAQDLFETFAASRGRFFGDSVGTVSTTASTESTTFPTGVLRIDRLQYIDSTTALPAWDLDSIKKVGAHAWNSYWPWSILTATSTGKPRGYWTNGGSIYWDPLPDATYTVRWYGFQTASDIEADSTFAYPDAVMLPLASFAVRLLKEGVGDDPAGVDALAASTFGPVLKALGNFNRDGASPLEYRYSHEV